MVNQIPWSPWTPPDCWLSQEAAAVNHPPTLSSRDEVQNLSTCGHHNPAAPTGHSKLCTRATSQGEQLTHLEVVTPLPQSWGQGGAGASAHPTFWAKGLHPYLLTMEVTPLPLLCPKGGRVIFWLETHLSLLLPWTGLTLGNTDKFILFLVLTM